MFKFSASAKTKAIPLVGTLKIHKGREVIIDIPKDLCHAFTKIIGNQYGLTPNDDGYILVIKDNELRSIGGPENFREKGRSVTFYLHRLQRWKDPRSRRYIWFFGVSSQELTKLRKAYGLSPSPHSRFLPQFILVIAEEAPHKRAEERQPSPDEDAVGIPDRDEYGDWSQLPVGDAITYVLHQHKADRAGEHYDLRFGTKEHGLVSWAVPKGLPKPGEKHLAVLQPLHSYDYKDFEGEIAEGYGKGQVGIADKGHVIITDISDNKIEFTIAHKRHPERFVLIKTKDKNWLLRNVTPQKPLPFGKKNSKSKQKNTS